MLQRQAPLRNARRRPNIRVRVHGNGNGRGGRIRGALYGQARRRRERRGIGCFRLRRIRGHKRLEIRDCGEGRKLYARRVHKRLVLRAYFGRRRYVHLGQADGDYYDCVRLRRFRRENVAVEQEYRSAAANRFNRREHVLRRLVCRRCVQDARQAHGGRRVYPDGGRDALRQVDEEAYRHDGNRRSRRTDRVRRGRRARLALAFNRR